MTAAPAYSAARKHVGPWRPIDPIAPMLAARSGSLGEALESIPTWAAIERKHDGWRVLVHVLDGGVVRFQSRSGKWFEGPAIDDLEDSEPLQLTPPGTVLDAELIDAADGRRPQPSRRAPLELAVFDVLASGGTPTTGLEYKDRRRLLGSLAGAAGIRLVEATLDVARAQAWVHEAGTDPAFDGVVVKPYLSVYRPGSRGTWRKVKP